MKSSEVVQSWSHVESSNFIVHQSGFRVKRVVLADVNGIALAGRLVCPDSIPDSVGQVSANANLKNNGPTILH